jgi:hypothetical protein
MSNPFDFSDFGAPRTPPASAPQPPGAPAAPGKAAPGAFDPWANQPPSAPAPRQPAGGADAGTMFGADPRAADLGGRDAFGNITASPSGALATAGPPLIWFGVAIALALGGALIAGVGALAGGMIGTAMAGWLLAGPAAIGALAVFNRVDTRRRTEAIYSAPTWTTTLYWVVLGLALVGIVIAAWQIALWAGTL